MASCSARSPKNSRQDQQQGHAARPGQQGQGSQKPDNARLPSNSVSRHSLDVKGATLNYTVTAGAIPLMDGQNRVLVEIAYVAYVVDASEPTNRPIAFAFNGGPGASSAYLHFGALGPKRLAFGNQGDGPSKPPVLADNPDTWLPFTDLVFIDPVGTGYSRFIADNEAAHRQFWSVDGDAQSLARVVAKYVLKNGRVASPKYLVGESYGGFRSPKVAALLGSNEGMAVAGLVLVSPVLDFTLRSDAVVSLPSIAARLPSMAAARLERDGQLGPARLAEVERYAGGDFVLDLMKGPRDTAAVERIVERVSAFTGLDPAFVRQRAGRIDMWSFSREFHRQNQRVGSSYQRLGLRLRPGSGGGAVAGRGRRPRGLARPADQRRHRLPHSHAQLEAGRAVPSAQRRGVAVLALERRPPGGPGRERPAAASGQRPPGAGARHPWLY